MAPIIDFKGKLLTVATNPVNIFQSSIDFEIFYYTYLD